MRRHDRRRPPPPELAVPKTGNPWSVNPERNPDSGVRNLPFGAAGMVTYLLVSAESTSCSSPEES